MTDLVAGKADNARFRGSAGEVSPDRRWADSRVVHRLRVIDFDKDSDVWQELADRLARYAFGVLVAWGITGKLREKVAGLVGSHHRLPEHLVLSEEKARTLTQEVLVVSLEKFRTKWLKEWNPERGACLTTFFIGCCLLDLRDVFPRWYREECQPFPIEHWWADDGRQGHRPDEEVETRLLLDEALKDDPDLRRVLELQDQGYTLSEIAGTMGQTLDGLRSATYRAKQRIRKEVK